MALISRLTNWTLNQIPQSSELNVEFTNITNILNGLNEGTLSWTTLKVTTLTATTLTATTSTITTLTIAGNVIMGGFKLTGLGAGTVNGDSLRYEQVVGLYLLLTGGTLSGNLALGGFKLTGLGAGTTSGDSLRYEQVINLYLLLTGGTLSGNLAFSPTTNGVVGTTTNNNTTAGNVGEAVQSALTGVSITPSATYVNVVSISLTAGDWDVSGCANLITTGVTTSGISSLAISAFSGNTTTDHVSGDNVITFGTPLFSDVGTAIPSWRVSISATTTYFLKASSTFSLGTPTCDGRISARRIR